MKKGEKYIEKRTCSYFTLFPTSNRQRDSLTCFTSHEPGNWFLTQNLKIMKAKVLITAFATVALLMSGTTAAAKGVGHNDMRGKMHRTERHFDNRHIGPRAVVAHRPIMGARFVNRPIKGRFVTVNRERLWLADGVFYKVVRTGNRIVYIVVGYL